MLTSASMPIQMTRPRSQDRAEHIRRPSGDHEPAPHQRAIQTHEQDRAKQAEFSATTAKTLSVGGTGRPVSLERD